MCVLHTFDPLPCLSVCRGKGEYFRLGSDNTANIKTPQKVEGLPNKKVVQVAVGAMHCLALTESGEVRRELWEIFVLKLFRKDCFRGAKFL